MKTVDEIIELLNNGVSRNDKRFRDGCERLIGKLIEGDRAEQLKLHLVSCCDFALWLQDNYSTNKKQGYTEPLPKGYWRKDFTNEHYSVTELAELYKKSYS